VEFGVRSVYVGPPLEWFRLGFRSSSGVD